VRYVGIIGYPLGHTLSPAFQQAAFDALGLDFRYETWETPPHGLPDVVSRLRGPDYAGANVTVPHKQAVTQLLDRLDDAALAAGAVNTIVREDDLLTGYNTDVSGFRRALREGAGFDAGGRRAVVLGAGGAARAVVLALIQDGAAAITVVNRTVKRAQQLATDLAPLAGPCALRAIALGPDLAASLSEAQLLINCTSVGMKGTGTEDEIPVDPALIGSQHLVVDLVYRPSETRLLSEARARGAATLDGLPMLIYQGADSFQMWTGEEPPVGVMFDAARKALAGGSATE